ncbi:DUF4892 domain-containing protein [Shewanella maritima]|uniref:DUF4892 domain-containing protein n=1 Tax=Shewanella maritima TaxID=2520507 RepID=A0A411PG48_9GAMM|nr:OmpA family protein [Shewanella maritima]QBF82531.1 DUF4892 domain-containing protein [Shewanella maritima]
MTLLRKLALTCTSIALLSTPSIAAEVEAVLFEPPAKVKDTTSLIRNYSPYQLITATKPKITAKEVKGKLTRISYDLSPENTPQNMLNNYLQHIKQLNGELIFSCSGEACGKDSKLKQFIKAPSDTSSRNPQIATALIKLDNKTLYTSIYAANWKRETTVTVDTIELIDEPLDLIKLDNDYLQAEVSEIAVKDRSSKDERGSQDHPMLSRMPGAYIADYKQFQFGQTKLITDKKNKKFITQAFEGKVTDINYNLPRSYSEYEVDANYKAALGKLGFKQIYQCVARECGSDTQFQQRIDALANIGMEDSQHYRLYQLQRPTGTVHVMTYTLGYIGGLYSEVRIVEETALNDQRVTIDLDGLTDKIAQTGHVALDGLLFEFDSDKLLPEALPVVEVVATYLKQNPKLRFYVVGHTDDQGKQHYNKTLSEKRAKAVEKRLIEQHQIAKKQIEAIGLGEYAPVASNMNDAGKKQNRRVELVLRSDAK